MPTINKTCKLKPRQPNNIKSLNESYYYNKYWKKIRNTYITEHPLCEECLYKGIYRPATCVHHIHEFMRGKTEQERIRLITDYGNLQSLCDECHKKKHRHKRI
jgi:5-methylcytosine-specific restriction protein A